ncbi:Na+/H+ antiporter NhaD [Oscillospiraceae bacterium]|nr:Na+/H+ antiporter NhaD [Oscillospiraceae bacterium]
MNKIITALKKDPVLYISGVLAIVSMFFVRPDAAYIGYINFKVLAILLGLMLIVSACVRIGTFDYMTYCLLRKIKGQRHISILLVVMSFFLSMLLTNDVTLVTLVPFAIMVLSSFKDFKSLMYTLIFMTVATNLGSMLTPIGNPQNLYLYTNYDMNLGSFLLLMLPYSALSLALISLGVFLMCKNKEAEPGSNMKKVDPPKASRLIIYIALFILCVLTVAGKVHWGIMIGVVAVFILIFDRKAFKGADYALLLTFIFFFVLIGNIGRITEVKEALSSVVDRSPVLTAVISSQFISNVPAAMLLSAFTEDGRSLVIGTNLGGLGTLIASMASLITYKYHAKLPAEEKGGKYIPAFTVINLILLAILLSLYSILTHI